MLVCLSIQTLRENKNRKKKKKKKKIMQIKKTFKQNVRW